MEQTEELLVKVLFVGNCKVGKTCILLNLTDENFRTTHNPTIGVEFGQCHSEDRKFKFQIWDTSGQESFKAIVNSYYRSSKIVVLVFDLSDRDSYEVMQQYKIKESRNMADDDNAQFLLIGNKSDLDKKVTTDEAEQLALDNDMFYCEYSAKNDLKMILISKLNEITLKYYSQL